MKRIPVEDLEHIYQNTQDIWESFRGKSIFVTGGTGFFGKWLLESFIYVNEKLSLNAKITTLSRNPEAFLTEYPFYKEHTNTVHFVKGDILTYDFNLEEKFQFIIHAATSSDEKANLSNPIILADSIIKGTKNILNFATKNPIVSFLNISSGAIYGNQPAEISKIKESDCFGIDLYNPKASYYESKRASEMYASLYCEQHNLPVKTARCFAFIGPYLPLEKHFAIGNFINDVLNEKNIIIRSSGTSVRSYMYMSDLVIWLLTILIKGKNNTPYNVGSDFPVTIKNLAEQISKNTKSSVIIHNAYEKSTDNVYIPNIEKSCLLGLSIKVDLVDSIGKTLKFYKS
jgi:nucleoside-diphosphate-sugar epimerase